MVRFHNYLANAGAIQLELIGHSFADKVDISITQVRNEIVNTMTKARVTHEDPSDGGLGVWCSYGSM